eukprot:1404713-Alexandrium_andersonii.AAC.1
MQDWAVGRCGQVSGNAGLLPKAVPRVPIRETDDLVHCLAPVLDAGGEGTRYSFAEGWHGHKHGVRF